MLVKLGWELLTECGSYRGATLGLQPPYGNVGVQLCCIFVSTISACRCLMCIVDIQVKPALSQENPQHSSYIPLDSYECEDCTVTARRKAE